jgi:hypothetical protein
MPAMKRRIRTNSAGMYRSHTKNPTDGMEREGVVEALCNRRSRGIVDSIVVEW